MYLSRIRLVATGLAVALSAATVTVGLTALPASAALPPATNQLSVDLTKNQLLTGTVPLTATLGDIPGATRVEIWIFTGASLQEGYQATADTDHAGNWVYSWDTRPWKLANLNVRAAAYDADGIVVGISKAFPVKVKNPYLKVPKLVRDGKKAALTGKNLPKHGSIDVYQCWGAVTAVDQIAASCAASSKQTKAYTGVSAVVSMVMRRTISGRTTTHAALVLNGTTVDAEPLTFAAA